MWEAELRESLARKKPVAAQLSKQDRQAYEKQLTKESEVRAQVSAALGRLRRGFELSLCLVNSKTELITEYLARMVNHVLTVIQMQPATLVAEEAFATYLVRSFASSDSRAKILTLPLATQALANVCSERLGVFKVALGVAVLRGVEAQVVPENFRAESLPSLVSRVLYQLRYLAESSAFDAGTYAYAAPLVSKILRSGGIGLESSEQEAALEQLSLALDFLAFHARQCKHSTFRLLVIDADLASPNRFRYRFPSTTHDRRSLRYSRWIPFIESNSLYGTR